MATDKKSTGYTKSVVHKMSPQNLMSITPCFYCGAYLDLHQYDTNRCPKDGLEEVREGFKQEWLQTTFRAKRDLFEELIRTIERNSVQNKATITNVELWAQSWRDEREGEKV